MGETTQGERESGRNDPGAKRLGAKGKVGETTQGRTGKWAKRPGFLQADAQQGLQVDAKQRPYRRVPRVKTKNKV